MCRCGDGEFREDQAQAVRSWGDGNRRTARQMGRVIHLGQIAPFEDNLVRSRPVEEMDIERVLAGGETHTFTAARNAFGS